MKLQITTPFDYWNDFANIIRDELGFPRTTNPNPKFVEIGDKVE